METTDWGYFYISKDTEFRGCVEVDIYPIEELVQFPTDLQFVVYSDWTTLPIAENPRQRCASGEIALRCDKFKSLWISIQRKLPSKEKYLVRFFERTDIWDIRLECQVYKLKY